MHIYKRNALKIKMRTHMAKIYSTVNQTDAEVLRCDIRRTLNVL